MLNKLFKDKKFRIKFFKNELKNIILQSVLKDQNLWFKYKNKLVTQNKENILEDNFIKNQQLNFKRVKFKNYCLLTGRSRSICSKLKISRIQIKHLFLKTMLFGFTKSSW